MTANEFLGQLEQCLSSVPTDERESAMSYYREYFMEAGEENEDEAAAHLGSPQSVAQRIISEMGDVAVIPENAGQPNSKEGNDVPSGSSIIIGIIVLIVGFPLWVTLLSLIFALGVTFIALLLSFAAVAILSPIQGVIDIANGYIGSGLAGIGGGLFSAGLVMLLWKPLYIIIVKSVQFIWKLVRKLFGRR